MKKAKIPIPSSLFHYTTLDSLQYILPSKEEDVVNGEFYMDFRFSHPSQCNDPMEMNFFTNSLYTGTTISNRLKQNIDLSRSRIGEPFIFSMIQHLRSVMGKCPLTEIPMWNMYGKNEDGVRLRLDYKSLKLHCKDNGISLFTCNYMNTENLRQVTQEIRDRFNRGEIYDSMEYEEIYKQYIKYKTISWSYEYEHRMAIWTSDYETIDKKCFFHVKIPLSCLKVIQISPFANYEEKKETVNRMIVNLRNLGYDNDLKIEPSKILIRK